MGFAEVVIVALVVVIVLLFLLSRAARPLAAPSPGSASAVPPTVDAATALQISALIEQGRKIEAIKLLRQRTGAGLREAKDWIDRWDVATAAVAAERPSPAASTDEQVLAIEARAVRDAAGPVAAIKHVRQRTGWGLVEVKLWVDRLD